MAERNRSMIEPPLLFMIMCLLVPCLAELPADQITSCLTLGDINNFTTFPNKENESAAYYKLLNFSIQNLRFADPAIPKPVAIILPESVEQLINSVSCSRQGLVEIRVRSGGHSYEGTSSVAVDGAPFVIIDMMNLNGVMVDLETETAWVEGGATLGETYHAIAQASNVHGFSAGSCPTVGAGGHIAGGGFGLMSRKYGVAADNVVDALLVDANGQLLDRQGMGEDVFWAIRGGGGGVFGIVYAWKIQLLKVPQVVTAFVVSRAASAAAGGGGRKTANGNVAKLVDKWQHVAPYLEDDFYISCFVGAGLPEVKTTVTATRSTNISATFKGFYLGPRSSAMSILNQVFPDLGIAEEECTEMSWIESIVFFSGLSKGSSVSDLRSRYLQGKGFFKAKSDYVRTPISYRGIRIALKILEEEPKGYVILDPYGGVMHDISSEAIAFPHRKGNLFTIQYLVEWKEEDNHKRNDYIEWIRRFYKAMTEYVSWGPRAAYINYVDLDLGVMQQQQHFPLNNNLVKDDESDAVEISRDWGEKYFLNNYDRLVRAKTLIDPSNVFRNQQGIPPMSSSSSLVVLDD